MNRPGKRFPRRHRARDHPSPEHPRRTTPLFATPRETIVKVETTTDEKFGCPPSERDIATHLRFGIVNLDKPAGPTSHEVSSWVKNILGAEKAGHGGTLDPAVTGVLPVALDDATKAVQALLPSGKEYIALMRLHSDVKPGLLQDTIEEFQGEILQKPPVRSAVRRRVRKRTIYYLHLLEIKGREVLLQIGCEAGTYIRKLCHDMGIALMSGAHMAELRRTRAGPFVEGESQVTLHDLLDAYTFWKEDGREDLLRKAVLPVEHAVGNLPKLTVLDTAVSAVAHGAPLALPGVATLESNIEVKDLVAIMSLKGELVAIGKATMTSDRMAQGRKGVCANIERVFIPRNAYPKMWHRTQS